MFGKKKNKSVSKDADLQEEMTPSHPGDNADQTPGKDTPVKLAEDLSEDDFAPVKEADETMSEDLVEKSCSVTEQNHVEEPAEDTEEPDKKTEPKAGECTCSSHLDDDAKPTCESQEESAEEGSLESKEDAPDVDNLGEISAESSGDPHAPVAESSSSSQEPQEVTDTPADSEEASRPEVSSKESFVPASTSHKKSKHKKNLTPRELKSRRVRRILILVIILLVAACGILPYLVFTHLHENQTEAVQQVLKDTSATPAKTETKDASTAISKKTEVPKLMELFGKTPDEALVFLGHGAFISGESEVKEPGNPVVRQINVPLTEEPADVRSGTPTVYLGVDKDNHIIQAGYSAATASLGFSPSSFADAVKNEGIIDKTLAEAGLKIAPDSVKLPSDRMAYTHMTPDNKTIAEEKCNFEGNQVTPAGNFHWSAVLSYNYTAANASGNLVDTIRQVSIFIKKV